MQESYLEHLFRTGIDDTFRTLFQFIHERMDRRSGIGCIGHIIIRHDAVGVVVVVVVGREKREEEDGTVDDDDDEDDENNGSFVLVIGSFHFRCI